MQTFPALLPLLACLCHGLPRPEPRAQGPLSSSIPFFYVSGNPFRWAQYFPPFFATKQFETHFFSSKFPLQGYPAAAPASEGAGTARVSNKKHNVKKTGIRSPHDQILCSWVYVNTPPLKGDGSGSAAPVAAEVVLHEDLEDHPHLRPAPPPPPPPTGEDLAEEVRLVLFFF